MIRTVEFDDDKSGVLRQDSGRKGLHEPVAVVCVRPGLDPPELALHCGPISVCTHGEAESRHEEVYLVVGVVVGEVDGVTARAGLGLVSVGKLDQRSTAHARELLLGGRAR